MPPGQLDLLVGLEPLEALRRVGLTSSRTLVLLDRTPVEPALARQTGYRVPPFAELRAGVAALGARVVDLDMMAVAQARWGQAVLGNLVALGWLAAADALPFPAGGLREAVATTLGPKGMHDEAWALGGSLASRV